MRIRFPFGVEFGTAKRACRGMTLVEVLIASTVGVAVSAGLLVVVHEAAHEQRRAVADAALLQAAANLQDKLMRAVRPMSQTESVIYGGPISEGSPLYQRIVMAKGPAPDWPRSELHFDPDERKVIFDPNRDDAGDEVVLFASNDVVVLRELAFFPSLKAGGVPDGTVVNVTMTFDDGGYSGRRYPDGAPRMTVVIRSFTIKMRNG